MDKSLTFANLEWVAAKRIGSLWWYFVNGTFFIRIEQWLILKANIFRAVFAWIHLIAKEIYDQLKDDAFKTPLTHEKVLSGCNVHCLSVYSSEPEGVVVY